MKTTTFTWLFTFLVLIELACATLPALQAAHYFTKPLIVISLLLFFLSKKTAKFVRYTMVVALLFSLGGDVLLLFTNHHSNFFIFGLLSFLLAHAVYIAMFSKQRNRNLAFWKPLTTVLIYAIGFFLLLKNSLGNMLLPVTAYMLVIALMAVFAFTRKGNVLKSSFIWVFGGALLFMLSDSLIAFNKFYTQIPNSEIWIMSTYALAQYFIVMGMLKNETVFRK